MTEQEQHDAEALQEAETLSPKLIFEVIRREGMEELERPAQSLLWSGIAAGLMISLSVLGEAVFRTYLPDTEWRYLVENLGYSLGFLVVILGRMQLFTENTITTVLPLMQEPTRAMLRRVATLWGIVLVANVVGTFAAAFAFAHTSAIPSELLPAIEELSRHATGFAPFEAFQRAIPAGVIIAAIVWMMPESDGFGYAIFGFFLPVLAGNILGGTVIFTLLAFGQVSKELDS